MGRKTSTRFAHLHLHTHYSLLDATIRIPELVRQVGRLGMEAVAVTDHGNLFGAFQFHQAALEAGIRPVLGCEVYVAVGDHREHKRVPGRRKPYHHLVLLAENQAGWRNLSFLVSEGYLHGFYYKPRISKEILAEHADGLIGLSACLSGEIAERLLERDLDGAVRAAEEYGEILGKDNFFLEIQDHGMVDEQVVREGMVEVARRTGLDLVATQDAHFHEAGDAGAHRVLLAIGRNQPVDELGSAYGYNDLFYLTSPEEMAERFRDYPGAVERTAEIASRCHVMFDTSTLHLPTYPVPAGMTPDGYLEQLAEKGLEERLREGRPRRHAPEAYRRRLAEELEIIRKMGFPGYFLVVWDFISFARRQGIPVGPGRGSAAGSLVSYALRITDVDPLEHELLFERFLNPERISMPDIDIDFCQRRRDEVIDYVRSRYGEDSVSQIATFNILKARSVVRDVGRVMGMPLGDVDRIARMIPEELGVTIDRALEESPDLRQLVEGDEGVRELITTAKKLEGLARHCGVHAAGVVIAPKPLIELVPLYRTGQGEVTTQFDKDDVERLGLLKMDFLGLRTLTVISDALESIRRTGGEVPDLEAIPLDDPAVFDLFARGETDGVFQFESSGMKEMLRRVEPRQFSDLAALNALYRPGPMQFIEDYAERRHGRRRVTYVLPELEEILGETYGIMVYQEQVMQIAVRVAGFTMAKADTLRKAMAKKKGDLIEKLGEEFVRGAVAKGFPKKKVVKLWEQIGPFAQYGFNKSHSVAYAYVAYLTAYLKAHYPDHFMAAMLTSEAHATDKLAQYLERTRAMGIRILPPDVNASDAMFLATGDGIRFGLEAIKGVGAAAVETILEARGNVGGFNSFAHFLRSLPGRAVNQKVVECLIKAGCFDRFGLPRGPLLRNLSGLLDAAGREREQQELGQGFLFDKLPSEELEREVAGEPEAPKTEVLAWEREVLGFYLSGHPLDEYRQLVNQYADTEVADLGRRIEEGWERVAVAGLVTAVQRRTMGPQTRSPGSRFARFRLEGVGGSVNVLMWPEVLERCGEALQEDQPVLVEGAPRGKAGSAEIVAERVIPLAEVERRRAEALRLILNLEEVDRGRLEQLREHLMEFPGPLPVRLELVRHGRFRLEVEPPRALAVEACTELLEGIDRLLGPGHRAFEGSAGPRRRRPTPA